MAHLDVLIATYCIKFKRRKEIHFPIQPNAVSTLGCARKDRRMAKITYKITATQMYGDKELDTITLRNGDGTICEELYNTISNNFWESVKACHGCEFEECEVWDMPCCKCKRISKDFYRQRKM